MRARVAALLELPGFEQVVAAWLQALANILGKLGLRSRVDIAIWSFGRTDSAA